MVFSPEECSWHRDWNHTPVIKVILDTCPALGILIT